MKRILLSGILLVLLSYGGCALYKALVSDETRIRWLIADTLEFFNEGDARDCVDGFHSSFVDETSGVKRGELHDMLRYLFLRDRRSGDGELQWRIEAPADDIQVTVEEERGSVDLAVVFMKRRDENWVVKWRVAIHVEVEATEDGWKFSRSNHDTIEGRRPF